MNTNTGAAGNEIFDMFMKSQFWPVEQILDFQRSQLAQLLRHAKANVPFYKTRLDCVLHADGSVDWDRWSEIPILTRADLRDHADEMRSRMQPLGHGVVTASSTSGSTGVPITVHHNALMGHVSSQAWQRFYAIHKLDEASIWADFRPPNVSGMSTDQEFAIFDDMGSLQKKYGIRKNLTTQRKLEILKTLGVKILSDLPTHIEVLARQNLRRDNPVKLKVVIAIGMGVSLEQRQLFLDSFGAKTLSPYSSKEGSLIAFECSHSPLHFHVNSELVFMEVLDDAGMPCRSSETGRSIVTAFYNTAQPIIRYDQGDQVSFASNHKCDITLPALGCIEGRSDPIFRFPGMDYALSYPNISLIQSSLSADAYQIAQTKPLNIEIRYVSQKSASPSSQDRIREHFYEHFPSEVQIDFVRVDDIPYNQSGKQQRIVREFD